MNYQFKIEPSSWQCWQYLVFSTMSKPLSLVAGLFWCSNLRSSSKSNPVVTPGPSSREWNQPKKDGRIQKKSISTVFLQRGLDHQSAQCSTGTQKFAAPCGSGVTGLGVTVITIWISVWLVFSTSVTYYPSQARGSLSLFSIARCQCVERAAQTFILHLTWITFSASFTRSAFRMTSNFCLLIFILLVHLLPTTLPLPL
jgi:hypothetical protein